MTYQTFPLSPAPDYYTIVYPAGENARNGITYVGDPVGVTLDKPGATSYEVRHGYTGQVITSGSVSGTTISLGTGWDPGPYRIYLFGPETGDDLFGDSYGAGNFNVIRQHPHFPLLPESEAGVFGYIPNGQGMTDDGARYGFVAPYGDGGMGIGYESIPNFDSPVEGILRSCLGIGMGRLSLIGKSNSETQGLFSPPYTDHDYYSDTTIGNVQFMERVMNPWWLDPSNNAYRDPVRTRYQWIHFPNFGTTNDHIYCVSGPGQSWAHLFPANSSVVANNVYVTVGPGTTMGTRKITVEYPSPDVVVETYDNLTPGTADVETAINGHSAYLRAFAVYQGGTSFVNLDSQQLGSFHRDEVAGAVADLYAAGITRFEGPYNEPGGDAYTAYMMEQFYWAVKDGHPDAKVVGPGFVNISDLNAWVVFGDAGGFDWCDEISFHDYNTGVNGDFNQARDSIRSFKQVLVDYGQQNKLLWQTEANHAVLPVLNVYHPRRSRIPMNHILVWEQNGLPFERNPYWYDVSHGFWSYPSFYVSGDVGVLPPALLICTYAQEVFGKAFDHPIDFGSVAANHMFLGNVYGDAVTTGGSVAVMVCNSSMPNSTVTLSIVGTTDDLTVVDGWGVETTVSQTAGRVTVDVGDTPTYVRLPLGVNAYVYSVRDWGAAPNPSVSANRILATVGGEGAASIADDEFFGPYTDSGGAGVTVSSADLPDTAEILFSKPTEVERLIVFCGPCWQSMSGLTEFTVDTYNEGTDTWTTRESIPDDGKATSFWHGTSSVNMGCQRETFWPEPWIFDVGLTSPITCDGVRINVTGCSFGGEPDAEAVSFLGKDVGQGGAQRISVQEMMVISPTEFSPGDDYFELQTADGAVGQWPMGEASGTTSNTLVNAPALNGVFSDVSGTVDLGNESPLTDGSTAWTTTGYGGTWTVPYNALLHLGDTFTIETWFKNGYSTFSGYDFQFYRQGNGTPDFGVKGATFPLAYARLNLTRFPSTNVGYSLAHLVAGVWYHVAVTKTGSTVHFYVNGIETTDTISNATFSDNTETNATALGGAHDISMCGLAIYPVALTGQQILDHYVAAIAPRAPTNSAVPVLSV